MSKFIPINDTGELLNADLIAHIVPADEGGCARGLTNVCFALKGTKPARLWGLFCFRNAL